VHGCFLYGLPMVMRLSQAPAESKGMTAPRTRHRRIGAVGRNPVYSHAASRFPPL